MNASGSYPYHSGDGLYINGNYADADGISQASASTSIDWFRHNYLSIVDHKTVVILSKSKPQLEYGAFIISNEDVGYFISARYEFTDDAGNQETTFVTFPSKIVERPNNLAEFDFSYSGPYTINDPPDMFVGTTVGINYSYSDYDGISNANPSVTWYAGQL